MLIQIRRRVYAERPRKYMKHGWHDKELCE